MRCRKSRGGARIWVGLLGALLLQRAAAAVNVCFDQSNPASSVDLRVARAALTAAGERRVQAVPFEGQGKGDDGFPVRRFARLAREQCDLIVGFPVDASDPHLPPQVLATPAYARTGFVWIGRSPLPAPAELPQGAVVGIAELDTWVALLFPAHPDWRMQAYPRDAELLAALRADVLKTGVIWQPYLVAEEKRSGARPLSFRRLEMPHLVWDLVALYAPGSHAAAERFARGLQTLEDRGRLAGLIAPYALPEQRSGSAAPMRMRPDERRPAAGGLRPVRKRQRSGTAAPPALYTAQQAERGALAYAQHCALCHGTALEGRTGPALKGPGFADPASDFHVGDIFGFIARMMPAATPGSLPRETYVDLMAFLLQQNGYPAGTQALSYDQALQSRVPLIYRDPPAAP